MYANWGFPDHLAGDQQNIFAFMLVDTLSIHLVVWTKNRREKSFEVGVRRSSHPSRQKQRSGLWGYLALSRKLALRQQLPSKRLYRCDSHARSTLSRRFPSCATSASLSRNNNNNKFRVIKFSRLCVTAKIRTANNFGNTKLGHNRENFQPRK